MQGAKGRSRTLIAWALKEKPNQSWPSGVAPALGLRARQHAFAQVRGEQPVIVKWPCVLDQQGQQSRSIDVRRRRVVAYGSPERGRLDVEFGLMSLHPRNNTPLGVLFLIT